MLKKRKFLIGGIIIFAAIGFLGVMGFQGAATYYYTAGELLGQGDTVLGQTVKLAGQVVPGSVERAASGLVHRFDIVDVEAGKSLPVVYQGVMPDSFKVGNDVVVEGELGADGVFQAKTIMVKCPSKYVPQ